MSLILNIDTTTETALANIAEDGAVLCEATNEMQNSHATFLHPAIKSILQKAGKQLKDLDAIAVSHGPGSYTGIRVGLAAAKGLCYAAGKPLIVVSQLEILAQDAISNGHIDNALYCPMIDARRMEVFAAVYDNELNELMPPSAVVLETNSFDFFLNNHSIFFVGTGKEKWQRLHNNTNALFAETLNKGLAFATLSNKKFANNEVANLAYTAPLYIKAFYTNANA